jgi:hypothetical protein
MFENLASRFAFRCSGSLNPPHDEICRGGSGFEIYGQHKVGLRLACDLNIGPSNFFG